MTQHRVRKPLELPMATDANTHTSAINIHYDSNFYSIRSVRINQALNRRKHSQQESITSHRLNISQSNFSHTTANESHLQKHAHNIQWGKKNQFIRHQSFCALNSAQK